jgi:predicted HicB family RNase H-like nuclease
MRPSGQVVAGWEPVWDDTPDGLSATEREYRRLRRRAEKARERQRRPSRITNRGTVRLERSVNVRVPEAVHALLEAESVRTGVSVGGLVRLAIRERYGR